ncbi:MAG: hypothetical protein Q8861_04955 [Bacteroidota bacterium]|nr:hypothetical protein [Bacteroidota bacterium]
MDNIELRSEKARNIIGKIPPVIVRSGISIVAAVFLILLVCSYYFPYTETISTTVNIEHSKLGCYGIVSFPVALQSKLETGEQAMIEVEGYSKNKFGQLKGVVCQKDSVPKIICGEKRIVLRIALKGGLVTSTGKPLTYYPGMGGKAVIFLQQQRLLNILFAWLKE